MTVIGRQCNAHREEKGGGACAHSTKVIFRLSVNVSATNCDSGTFGERTNVINQLGGGALEGRSFLLVAALSLCLQAAEGDDTQSD